MDKHDIENRIKDNQREAKPEPYSGSYGCAIAGSPMAAGHLNVGAGPYSAAKSTVARDLPHVQVLRHIPPPPPQPPIREVVFSLSGRQAFYLLLTLNEEVSTGSGKGQELKSLLLALHKAGV